MPEIIAQRRETVSESVGSTPEEYAAFLDAERAKMDADKAAAVERHAAGKRTEAAESFVRFQSLKRSYNGLKNKETAAALRLRQQQVATAESCTGGLIAGALTAIPGSSDWFGFGWVSYANDAKQQMLGVTASTLARHGAVSADTVGEMATGARQHSGGHRRATPRLRAPTHRLDVDFLRFGLRCGALGVSATSRPTAKASAPSGPGGARESAAQFPVRSRSSGRRRRFASASRRRRCRC